MNGVTRIVDDPSDPYDGKSTLGGLPYLGPGYGDPDSEESVVVLVCPQSEDPAVWTTAEQFNDHRAAERATVDPSGALAWGGGWKCPDCGEYHGHDVELAQGATVAELRDLERRAIGGQGGS